MNIKRLLLCASISITMLLYIGGVALAKSWTQDMPPAPPSFSGGLPGSVYGNDGNPVSTPVAGEERVVSNSPLPPAVPEPSSLLVIGAGVSALGYAIRYRKNRKTH